MEENEKMVRVTVQMTEGLAKRIHDASKLQSLSSSAMIRRTMTKELNRLDNENSERR